MKILAPVSLPLGGDEAGVWPEALEEHNRIHAGVVAHNNAVQYPLLSFSFVTCVSPLQFSPEQLSEDSSSIYY
jgi:hypothetical protein